MRCDSCPLYNKNGEGCEDCPRADETCIAMGFYDVAGNPYDGVDV